MAIEPDVDLWVARRLKALRSERGITLAALAGKNIPLGTGDSIHLVLID